MLIFFKIKLVIKKNGNGEKVVCWNNKYVINDVEKIKRFMIYNFII